MSWINLNGQAEKFPALLLCGYLNVYGDAPACHSLDCADLTHAEPDSPPPLLYAFICVTWLTWCTTEDKACGGTTALGSPLSTQLLNSLRCSV